MPSETAKIVRDRKTRIVATLGPASSSYEMIEKLFIAGVDVFRLNMSHGGSDGKDELIANIRAVEKRMHRPIAILADLQGPKLRIGQFENGSIMLNNGDIFHLDMNSKLGNSSRVTLPHKEIFEAMNVGTHLLLDDGKVKLEVTNIDGQDATCKVLVGGKLSDRKGVNVPNTVLPIAALTEKDRADLSYAVKAGCDWIALSFVQRPADVAEAKKLAGPGVAIMAKIEKPAAIDCLSEIVEYADGVMVARGDLGVEEPMENVPGLQKQIVRCARLEGKPVIVATQMLESMISSPVPTRAEVTDVANAVLEGADAVMLSAESAVGEYPIEAVSVMNRVTERVENDPTNSIAEFGISQMMANSTPGDAITAAARTVATTVHASAIVTFTSSGTTALRAARERPEAPILVLTPRIEIARRLALVWGLHTVKTKDINDFEHMIGKAKRMAFRTGLVTPGDRIVVTAGVPFGTPGATNVLHIAWINGNELN
ncbi:pyruvate kinase [Temperatibacter marinus]|uniref:Pyruvate kinase n=1 Tax=Temperatibacter marinus TaxID=1456591 RepID=A0AA52EEY6_9PROT|nr:pyruvate kinase [Temperatibacter marinus]WND01848.1 pyruvate kinase [Temperatibacter marinus]